MTQNTYIEYLKFARKIGATHNREDWCEGLFRNVHATGYEYWNKTEGKWRTAQTPQFRHITQIDFTPLEKVTRKETKMAKTNNIEQKDDVNKGSGEPLTWPISEELIGRKVRFDGYVTGNHDHWGYVFGEEYVITVFEGFIGPANNNGAVPSTNYDNDFKFTLLPKQTIPAGYYHDDEEGKLKPLKPQADQQVEVVDAMNAAHDVKQDPAAMERLVKAAKRFNEKNKPDVDNQPPHHQTDGIECIDAIRAALGLDDFVAYCRGKAIEHVYKKDCSAQDLRKAAWYLYLAANQ